MWLDADSDTQYWDFSFEEKGDYDLRAAIDFIQKNKGNQKLSLIGYSQGTTTMMYAMSQDPDYYAERVNLAVALAPAIFFNHCHE